MKVLFMAYADFSERKSGSAVRPYQMFLAFQELGYEVLLIQGNRTQRHSSYEAFKKNGSLNDVDYCYIEPSTYPIHPMDYPMYREISRRKIPIGIFYRDMHYKFPDLFVRKGLKKYFLRLRYALDWRLFQKVAKTIFFPSETMASWFRTEKKAVLPPAGENRELEPFSQTNQRAIYVGGVNRRYGTDLMLQAFQKIYNEGMKVSLTLVCRPSEVSFIEEFKREPWLNIVHGNSDELEPYYKQADVGILPLRKNTYNDLAVSVKLFEYMSYGLTLCTTHCTEMAKIVERCQAGCVVKDNVEDMAEGIRRLFAEKETLLQYRRNAVKCVQNENLWIHRVHTLEQTLMQP